MPAHSNVKTKINFTYTDVIYLYRRCTVPGGEEKDRQDGKRKKDVITAVDEESGTERGKKEGGRKL